MKCRRKIPAAIIGLQVSAEPELILTSHLARVSGVMAIAATRANVFQVRLVDAKRIYASA